MELKTGGVPSLRITFFSNTMFGIILDKKQLWVGGRYVGVWGKCVDVKSSNLDAKLIL